MTSAQVVETSVKVTTNSPSQDYTHPDDHNLRTYDMTPGFKPFTILKTWFIWAQSLEALLPRRIWRPGALSSVCGEPMPLALHSPLDVKFRSHCIHPTGGLQWGKGALSVSYREALSKTYRLHLLSHSRLLKVGHFSRGRSSAIRFCWRFRRPRCVCMTERDG